ncbi:hypothetical protein JQR85_10765 [Stutzerimonas urumqiensis]|uniref:hypothetical protein n=1 Tax=Stutzerimonas urumqiensis TaxID=638269 RepID=UPI003DA43E96
MNERNDERHSDDQHKPAARWASLWLITVSPTIWAVHFLLCYVTAAIWCARVAGRNGMLGDARLLIAAYTVVALAGIVLTAWRGYRQHSYGEGSAPHNEDSSEDRYRFLGYATLLLSGLSAVATIFVALSAVFIRSCA